MGNKSAAKRLKFHRPLGKKSGHALARSPRSPQGSKNQNATAAEIPGGNWSMTHLSGRTELLDYKIGNLCDTQVWQDARRPRSWHWVRDCVGANETKRPAFGVWSKETASFDKLPRRLIQFERMRFAAHGNFIGVDIDVYIEWRHWWFCNTRSCVFNVLAPTFVDESIHCQFLRSLSNQWNDEQGKCCTQVIDKFKFYFLLNGVHSTP